MHTRKSTLEFYTACVICSHSQQRGPLPASPPPPIKFRRPQKLPLVRESNSNTSASRAHVDLLSAQCSRRFSETNPEMRHTPVDTAGFQKWPCSNAQTRLLRRATRTRTFWGETFFDMFEKMFTRCTRRLGTKVFFFHGQADPKYFGYCPVSEPGWTQVTTQDSNRLTKPLDWSMSDLGWENDTDTNWLSNCSGFWKDFALVEFE